MTDVIMWEGRLQQPSWNTLRIVFMSSRVTFMELMVVDLGTFIQSMYCNRTYASFHYSFF